MKDERTFFELSDKEISERKKLTEKEKAAAADLINAVKALPRSLCIDYDDGEFKIYKRITRGSATTVRKVKRKSLVF